MTTEDPTIRISL